MSAGRRRAPAPTADEPEATTPAPSAPTRGGRSRRREAQAAAREADQARTRRKLVTYGVPAAIVAVLVLVVGAVLLTRGGGSTGGAPAAAERTQRTLLIQLIPAVGRAAVGNALTASATDGGSAAFASIPGRLITDVPGGGRTTLDQTTVTASGTAAAQALADQLGVIVDGSWVMTGPSLASLIDKVGGVTVDVDVQVTATSGGSTVVVVPPGKAQKLTGPQAVAYATFLGPNETEQARLARFTAVWTDLLRRLPDDRATVQRYLTGNAGSVSSLSTPVLAAYLVDLHDAVVSNSMAYPTLPTAVVDTGSASTTYRVDSAKVPTFAKQYFAGSLPPTPAGGPVTVLVQNGVGTPGLVEKARAKLIAAGLTYQGGGNASRFGYPSTVVLIPDASAESRRRGAAVAAALGLPASAVQQVQQGQNVADVLVILGADFRG